MVDTLENIVIDYSLNEKGALSSDRPYIGIIGNEIWSLYDIVLDPVSSSVWVKRNENQGTYAQSSVTHMVTGDRTDIFERIDHTEFCSPYRNLLRTAADTSGLRTKICLRHIHKIECRRRFIRENNRGAAP